MIIIISNQTVKTTIRKNLSACISYDKWIVVRQIPRTQEEIMSTLNQHSLSAEKGQLLIFANLHKHSPADFPGLFVEGLLLSLMFYRKYAELHDWIATMGRFLEKKPSPVFVLGTMKPFYMQCAKTIHHYLQANEQLGKNAHKLLPDKVTRDELVKKLSKGCLLAIYVGHGRSRGWSGYRGVRWNHVESVKQKEPVGTIISLSCDGLKKDKQNSIPFLLQWVSEGRACTSITSCDVLQIKPLEIISTALMESISTTGITRIDELLFSVDEKLRQTTDPVIEANWRQFRLIGNPFQAIK